MFELTGVPPRALCGQLLLGLINGAFYALLSLGPAVTFGLMNDANGVQYMMGAFCAWMLLTLIMVPIMVGVGLAGATKAIVFQLASLTDVTGGMGTVFGPVVGAAVIITTRNCLVGFGEWVLVIQGLIFVLTVLLFRRGIVGEIIALRQRRGEATRRFRRPIALSIQ